MDGTTEPILVVIGNPIAGNPAQFALERSLRALDLDWRVLSFDVIPDHVPAAIGGFAVTGIVGVLVSRELASSAGFWRSQDVDAGSEAVDCFFRDEEGQFQGEDQTLIWLEAQIEKFSQGRRLWIGGPNATPPMNIQNFEQIHSTQQDLAQLIKEASVIVINPDPTAESELDLEDWPDDSGETLVIDLGIDPKLSSDLSHRGYLVIGEDEFRIGSLQFCITRWTGQTPSDDVIIDAIEEYLSV